MITFVLARRHGQELELSLSVGGLFTLERQPAADAYTLTAIRELSENFAKRAAGPTATALECVQAPDATFRTVIVILENEKETGNEEK